MVRIYVFDIHLYQDFSSVQPMKARLDFRPLVEAARSLLAYSSPSTENVIN